MLTWIVTAAAALQAVSIESRPLLTFSARTELRRTTTQVDVGVLTTHSGPKHYWFRKSVRPGNGRVAETRWADTRSCAGGRDALEELAMLDLPRPRIYGLDGSDDITVTADGVIYRLETETGPPFQTGQMSLTTNTGTPLARWVEAAFVKLSGCWTEVPPKRDS